MSTEMTLPVDSPISGIPTSESATAEENRMLRLRVMEMWDAWTNGKDPPKVIPGFPELSPRPTGTSNVPISHPNIPSGRIPQKPKYSKEEDGEVFTAGESGGICGAMRKMLYETHMVQSRDGTSIAEVSYMGPSAKLQNWKATPFLIRQESQ